jgi:starch-binding outer membrane protein, SusD/RagB family
MSLAKWTVRAAAGLPLAAVLACSDWLTSPEAAKNPNQPTQATINQLFVAAQTSLTVQYTSDLARTACVWMQQCAGTERQYQQLGLYSYGEDSYDASFSLVYTGGGLIDIRRMQALADSAGDKVYGGIARIMEAMQVGLAADIWGDIPYSEAVSNTEDPKLDPQQQVYAAVQAKLDTAITLLTAGTGAGPGAVDLFYGGDKTKWLRLAHTLKARYHMHVAERVGQAAYQAALSESQLGLQPGDNFLGLAAENPQSYNAWYQFTVIQRAGYMFAGSFLVDLLKQRNDPRLSRYFLPNAQGQFVGAKPGDQTSAVFSGFTVEKNPAYRQPIVTWQENELIKAEAAFRLGNTALALQAVNRVRVDAGLAPLASVTLNQILEELYIVLFQNPEVWSVWKRTCYPALTPAPGSTSIPGRLLYAAGERNANRNVPAPGQQPARNWNDPAGCS